MHRQYVHLGSRTLSYFDTAPADRHAHVLVLVHAFPLGAGMWESQLRWALPGWRLIAPDLRGFGGSTIDIPDDNPSIDDYGADIVDLLKELHVSSAVIGGCSLGGYAVFAALRRQAALARAVVLIDTRAGADSSEARENRRGLLALLDREGPSGVARDMMPKLLGKTTRAERSEVEPFVRRLVKQQSAEALRGAIQRMMVRPDSAAVLESLTVPTLIMVGEEDTLTPPEEAQKMAALVAGAQLVVLPRAGHLPSLEQPQLFNDTLAAFLTAL